MAMTQLQSPLHCPVCACEVPVPPAAGPAFCPRPSCGVEFLEGAPLRARTFRLADHGSCLVLPFSFAASAGADPLRRLQETRRWQPQTFTLASPEDVERTEYFLPYIRRFLFPTLYSGDRHRQGPESEPSCQRFTFDLSLLAPVRWGGVALTLRCHDPRKKLRFEHPIVLTRVELILFSSRVGFLVLRVRCAGRDASYFDQMNTVVYLRTIAPLYRGFEMPELLAEEAHYGVPQLLAYLLAEFSHGRTLPAFPEQVAAGAPLPVRLIYDDRMMVYTFSCLDQQTILADAARCQSLLHRAAVLPFDLQASTLPQREGMEQDQEAWLRTRWQGFSKDGGSLVVFNTDAYHERYLGTYHGTYYFDIFLLATLQRVTLLTLYERLSDIPGLTRGGRESRRLLRAVRRDLLSFTNQCLFSQITNRERGLVLWKKWQSTLETEALSREVREQSEELDSYLQGRYRERMERLLRIGGFLAAAIPLVLGLEALTGQTEWARALRWALLGLVMIGAALAAWALSFRDREE
jgi:hypothetical protein